MPLLLLWFTVQLHPYHVSVADIVYNEEADAIQISYRMFLDDLEEALRRETANNELDIVRDSSLVRKANSTYFRRNFLIKVNDQPADWDYIGSEVEDDGLWTYLEVKGIKDPPKIEVTNRLLLEMFDDQQNILHFKIDGDKKSYIMNAGTTQVSYEP